MKRPALIALLVGMLCCATRGFAAELSVADLIESLKAADTASQIEALVALEAKGPHAAKAVPALIGLLKSASADVRAHAAEALGAIGSVNGKSITFNSFHFTLNSSGSSCIIERNFLKHKFILSRNTPP